MRRIEEIQEVMGLPGFPVGETALAEEALKVFSVQDLKSMTATVLANMLQIVRANAASRGQGAAVESLIRDVADLKQQIQNFASDISRNYRDISAMESKVNVVMGRTSSMGEAEARWSQAMATITSNTTRAVRDLEERVKASLGDMQMRIAIAPAARTPERKKITTTKGKRQ